MAGREPGSASHVRVELFQLTVEVVVILVKYVGGKKYVGVVSLIKPTVPAIRIFAEINLFYCIFKKFMGFLF